MGKRKIIIFEAPDRCGKDTQIEKLRKWDSKTPYHILHYGKPVSENPQKYQERLFAGMFEILQESSSNSFILNRSHIGEHIYGKMYRKYDANWIWDAEKYNFEDEEVLLIVFIDDPKNLMNREDGNSYSKDRIQKTMEVELFKEAFALSTISNKLLIDIRDKTIDDVFELVKSKVTEVYGTVYNGT